MASGLFALLDDIATLMDDVEVGSAEVPETSLGGLEDAPAPDAAPAPAADRHGLALQLRIVALFDAGEEGVHVDMDDLPEAGSFLAMLIGRRVVCHGCDK